MSFTHTGRSLSPPSQNRLQQDANYVSTVKNLAPCPCLHAVHRASTWSDQLFSTLHIIQGAENLEKFTMYKIMNIQNEIGYFSEIEKYVKGEILKRF